jgi:MFS family permease
MTTTVAPPPSQTTAPPTRAANRRRARHGTGFWAIAYAFLIVMAYNAVPAPLYGIYQQRDGFSSFTITVIFAAYAVGVVISLFTVGHLSDWHGRRRLFAPALVLCMISAAVFLLWRDLPGLILARVLGGIAVGAVTATATAWLAELHAAARPDASAKRAQVVSTAANLGGIGFGPLVAGALAEWVRAPLTVPYVVALVALAVALIAVVLSPETRERPQPRPRYRSQRVSVPRDAIARYFACGIGAAISFAVFGLFTSLAPTVLAGTLHYPSYALAGATAFAVFAAAVVAQMAIAGRPTSSATAGGIATMVLGMVVLVVAVFLPSPSLALFEIGGVITGAGAGALFKGVITSVAEIAPTESRAEALAGMFLAGYIGLSIPVLGLGVMTQYLSARVSLAIFTGVLVAAILAATPPLLQRRSA